MPTPRKKRSGLPRTTPKTRPQTDEEIYQDFLENSGIRELGMRLRVLEAQRQAMGLAPWDREPLSCPKCGLFEGEDDQGMLFTSRESDSRDDSGLRFEKLTDGRWLCPCCCAKIVEPEFEIPPDFWDYDKKGGK